ncbi:RepB family protein [uncultured Clostridium sp.]|jgi:hypothetical protein|uniref:RepB family protein n=1 Tax=uncultured Clostridium sp. TaxID=59620 RepID=UPI0025FB687A|nr:RepB family protein [uncultured Clostridium sp.]
MSRQRTYKKALNCRLDGNVWDALEDFCEETGLTKTSAVERAIMKYVELHNKEQEQLKYLKQNKE